MALGEGPTDIMEVFGPGCVTDRSGAFDLRPGLTFDYTSRNDPKHSEKGRAG